MHFSRIDAISYGIWLVYLFPALVPALNSEMSPLRVALIVGLAAYFCIIYVLGAGFEASIPQNLRPRFLSIWMLLLSIAPLVLAFQIGWHVIGMLPYFLAILLFAVQGRLGYIMVALIVVSATGLLLWIRPDDTIPLLMTIWFSSAMIVCAKRGCQEICV